jgi:hypothetical protein
MPTGFERCTRRKQTWKNMDRHQRKAFHRENRCREIEGLPLLKKP